MMQMDMDDAQIPMLYAQYLLSKGMEAQSIPVLEQVVQIDPTNKACTHDFIRFRHPKE